MAVHDFWRWSTEGENGLDPRRTGPFRTALPNSPMSYRGAIVKIHWCVRVRAFLTRGRELKAEMGFRLGDVRPARLAACCRPRGQTVESPAEPVEVQSVAAEPV
jgi:hypothetical protein